MMTEKQHIKIHLRVGKSIRTVLWLREAWFCVDDVIRASWETRPRSLSRRLPPSERKRMNIGGRSVSVVSRTGLMCLIPQKPESDRGRKVILELIVFASGILNGELIAGGSQSGVENEQDKSGGGMLGGITGQKPAA